MHANDIKHKAWGLGLPVIIMVNLLKPEALKGPEDLATVLKSASNRGGQTKVAPNFYAETQLRVARGEHANWKL